MHDLISYFSSHSFSAKAFLGCFYIFSDDQCQLLVSSFFKSCSVCCAHFRGLSDLQAQLLEEHVHGLRHMLRPGSKRLNWNSLGIHDYIVKCESVRWERLYALVICPWVASVCVTWTIQFFIRYCPSFLLCFLVFFFPSFCLFFATVLLVLCEKIYRRILKWRNALRNILL